MKRSLILLSLLLSGAAGADPIAFTHVNLIDGRGGPVATDVTVVIDGDKIVSVGKKPPAKARIVDGTGKYLIPGLWDLHVHSWDKRELPLYVANGVIGVRQMVGAPVLLDWGKAIAAGKMVGPRHVVVSPLVDGPDEIWPGSLKVASAREAQDTVKAIKKGGYAAVKVYSRLSPEAFRAVAAAARKHRLPVVGHVPSLVGVVEASDAGLVTLEHMYGLLMESSTEAATLRPALAALYTGTSIAAGFDKVAKDKVHAIVDRMLATYDEKLAAAMFERLAKNGTFLSPTFIVTHAMASLGDPGFLDDPRLKYLPRAYRDEWNPKRDPRTATDTDEDYARDKAVLRKLMELVPLARRAGVRFIAGSDAGNPYCFHGFGLHDELELLVKAGLTPMEALQAATRNAGDLLGDRRIGTVEKGKVADLVLLDANPLDDITNTRKIFAVVRAGRLHTRADLDAMLAEAERIGRLRSAAAELRAILGKGEGDAAALALWKELRAKPDLYEVNEMELNGLGYQLLGAKKLDQAIIILRLNAESFPESANVHDSLGEALAAAGQTEAAIASYRRALALDPTSKSAAAMLEKLGASR